MVSAGLRYICNERRGRHKRVFCAFLYRPVYRIYRIVTLL